MKCRTESLFMNKEGTPMRYTSLLQTVQNYCHDDEIHIATHTFRRSCATELLKADANMWHVKELLGHESLDTLKHYVKLTIVDLKKTHRKCHPRDKTEGNEVAGG